MPAEPPSDESEPDGDRPDGGEHPPTGVPADHPAAGEGLEAGTPVEPTPPAVEASLVDAGVEPEGPSDRRWLTKGVLGVGGASLFSDASHEWVTSLLPTFLTTTLHSGPAALGAIEGFSDALVGLSKLAGGPLLNDRSAAASSPPAATS